MAAATREDATAGEVGRQYDDVRLLRAGSRFAVYDAADRDAARRVAVKVPADVRATWLHDVLRGEGRILEAVGGHPNVVTLYRQLRLDDKRPALVLERCVGSLAETVHHGGSVALPAAVSIGIELAGALDATHDAGWLHCDVRPDNVLLTERGTPVLAGFDEAVANRPDAARGPRHGMTVYTAPELLEDGEPSPRSDVYGLAATLYELIAGRAAFRAYAGESAAAVIVRVLESTARPIVAPGVPFELSDLLTWGMAPDPAERPPSPAWFAEELRRLERANGWTRGRHSTLSTD